MRYICPHCKQTSVDGNLWCQDVDCPAGRLPSLLNYGDIVGPLHILRQVRVLRAAVIYEAKMFNEVYYMKIANTGDEAYLKQEARALAQLRSVDSPYLPVWCPHGAENSAEPHGEIIYRGRLLCYILFKKVPGDFLDDFLLNNPQPWHRHIGWFLLSTATALRLLHQAGGLHLNIAPENILVWHNRAGIPQPLLLDAGVLVAPNERWSSNWRMNEKYMSPAYLAPEIVQGGTVTAQTDVYLLGILMYEMLNGQPAFDARLRKTDAVRAQIQNGRIKPLIRDDLKGVSALKGQPVDITNVARTASSRDVSQRFSTVDEFYQTLGSIYGAVPDRRPWYQPSARQLLIVLGIAVGIAVIIILMLLLATVDTTNIN